VEDFQLLSSPAVADVSDAPGPEIIAGTGLYYLRNINASGAEGSGWPKFTGGWIFVTPAVGDVDGDGKLDVAAMTREGWSFLWRTDRPACGGNDEWWTSRHDEWGTGAYGTDSRPPGTPRAFRAATGSSTVELGWIAPGDDWLCGKAKQAVVLASSDPITRPSEGKVIARLDATSSGNEVRTTVNRGTKRRYHAVAYVDDAGNWGHPAGLSKAKTKKKRRKPVLKVRIVPGTVPVRRRTCFSVRVTANGKAVRKALIHINGKGVRRTDRRGRAVLCRRYFTPGTRSVKAARGGYTSGRTKLRVTAPRSPR
jgi:hypothetical protein